MTAILILAHAFGTNKKFKPEFLYLLAFYLDYMILVGVFGG